jgi:hypothetical protein
MAKSSMILKMAAMAVVLAAGGLLASTPAGAYTAVNGIPFNGVEPNALNPNAIHPNALIPNGVGANSAAGRTFDASRQASGVDVNRLRLRAIVLPGEPGRPTAE